MKTPFLDYWTSRAERQEFLEKRHKIKLTPAQLSTLLGDSDARAALQQSRVASLLPPVGTEVFRRFTPTSLEQIKKCMGSKKNKQDMFFVQTTYKICLPYELESPMEVFNLRVEEDYCLKPAPELESEKVLPFFYGAPPPELRNVPLEDPDPFYQSQKTFVVVDRENIISRFNAESSCFNFSPFSWFRRAAIKILNHKLFTALLCVALVVNFFVLMPREWEYIIELVCMLIYLLEAVLKILARGFCLGRFTYLRDSWNRLDFVIVTTGFAFFSIEELWFFKALRFIKILGLFPATRRNTKMFGHVLNRLWDVFLLTLLVLSVFSITGTAVLSGSLRNKCVMWPWAQSNSSDLMDSLNDTEFDYMAYINDNDNHYYSKGHIDPLICGNATTSIKCPEGYMCIKTSTNPNYGLTSFDHFGYSFLSTFRLMTRDFWEALANQAMHSEGREIMGYFVVVLFICSFSLTAFIMAAFTITFTEQNELEIKKTKQDQRDYDKILAALKDKCGIFVPDSFDCSLPAVFHSSRNCQVEDELPEKKDSEQISCWRRTCSCDCCDCWVRFKNGLQVFVLDPFFDLAIIILIILSVCLESSNQYPMEPSLEVALLLAKFVITVLFFLEVVLKILAMGPYEFFKVNWHYFDTILVFLNLVDLTLAEVEGFSVFGVVYILRLFRLGRWWPGLLKWMRLVWAGLCSLWTLSLVLITLFFSTLGMFMFSQSYADNVCKISDDCNLPRWSWHTFIYSFMTVTRALFGEWIETLWDCLETSNNFVCVVFYFTLLIVGNFLIFTLLLTLLMKWFSDKLAAKDEEKMKTCKTRIIKMLKVCGINTGGKAKEEETVATEDTEAVVLSVTSEQTEGNGTHCSTLPIGEAQNFQKMKETEEGPKDPEDCCCQKCYSCCPCLNLDKSQGCGGVWAKFRRIVFTIVQHPYFNNFIFLLILISSLALMFDDIYNDNRFFLRKALPILDFVIVLLFALEVLIKWIGLGFVRYFRDGWCWVDFIVTLGCALSFVAEPYFLRPSVVSLKTLRPLRILAHIKGTRRSVCGLLKLLPSLLNVLLVTLTVWLFFGVVFVDSYSGRFYYCFNETSEEIFHYEDVHNKSECMMLIDQNFTEVRWKNALFNFDDIFEAHLSLFFIATLKGWIDLLYSAIDSTRVEEQPEYERSVYGFLCFLFFILFGGFFCLIHILKVLFDAYSSHTKKGRLHGRLFDLVSRERFEWVMQGVILFSVVLLMIDRYDMSVEEEYVCYYLFLVVLVIFLFEFLLKICAFRRSYFSDNLNTIDFVVLILQIVGIFISDLMEKYFISASCLHLLRLARISRIIHRFPGALRLRILFAAWTKSLRAIFNLALVLFVLMFTYACFGMFHFYHLEKIGFISDIVNFETIGGSLLCMWTVTMWGGWDGLILPTLLTPPDCSPPWTTEKWSCANPGMGVAFFVSFLCLSSFLVLMMVLVVLVDMLNAFAEMRCDPLSDLNLSHFFKTWRKFAPDSSDYIQRSQLPDLCDKLKKPLRIPKPTELDLELRPEDQVHCRDVLLALSVQALGDCADRDALRARISEKYHEFMPNNLSQESCEMTNCAPQMNQEEAANHVTENVEE